MMGDTGADRRITADDARRVQDEQATGSGIASDRDRAAASLADILAEDLDEVSWIDEDGEESVLLSPGGDMLARADAGAVTVTDADTDASDAGVELANRSATSAPSRVVSDEDVEVECPGCGLTVVGSDPRPTAAWFCPRCDYPLFFVQKPSLPEPDLAKRGARRRLPGVSGRAVTAAGPCWNCNEWNEAGITTCLRCAASLPKPTPPRIEVPEVEPEEPEIVEVEILYWPPIVLSVLGGFGAGIAFLAGVLLALGRW